LRPTQPVECGTPGGSLTANLSRFVTGPSAAPPLADDVSGSKRPSSGTPDAGYFGLITECGLSVGIASDPRTAVRASGGTRWAPRGDR
jgi:hypothetical protein